MTGSHDLSSCRIIQRIRKQPRGEHGFPPSGLPSGSVNLIWPQFLEIWWDWICELPSSRLYCLTYKPMHSMYDIYLPTFGWFYLEWSIWVNINIPYYMHPIGSSRVSPILTLVNSAGSTYPSLEFTQHLLNPCDGGDTLGRSEMNNFFSPDLSLHFCSTDCWYIYI